MPSVLLIDDEPENLDVLRRLFERDGWAATCLGDSTRAVAELARVRPDVVLLDLMMPVMDGMDVLREIRADRAAGGTPVVIYSSVSDDRTRERAFQAGAADYIVKTTPFAQIRERLVRLMKRAA